MAGNSRLAIAVHIAGMLSFGECAPLTSESIARSVGTNPVVVRRIIGLLTRAGIVSVRKGAGGGAILSRPAGEISLREIYAALGEKSVFDVPSLGGDHACAVARIVRPILASVLRDAEAAMSYQLGKTTLADLILQVRKQIEVSGACTGIETHETQG